MTISEAQTKLDELVASLGSGAQAIRYADRGVDYATVEERLRAIQYLQGFIASGGVVSQGISTSFASHSRE